jgi:hypothetical protein
MNRLTVAALPAAAFGVAFLFSAGTPPAQPIPSGPALRTAAPLPALVVNVATPPPQAQAAKRPAVRHAVRRRAPRRHARPPVRRVVVPAATAAPVATATPVPAPIATPPPPPPPRPKPKPVTAPPARDFDSSGGFDSQG